jgi:hypothetical protein
LCTKAAVGSFYKTKPLVEIEGYFRLDGRCEECPKNPILLFVFFFLAVFLVVIGGFVLSQKDFNIAFISIGVDYFQVLAVFKSARVEWPRFLKDLLILFTFFNFEIGRREEKEGGGGGGGGGRRRKEKEKEGGRNTAHGGGTVWWWWFCLVLLGTAWYCLVLLGTAWYCLVLLGTAWSIDQSIVWCFV